VASMDDRIADFRRRAEQADALAAGAHDDRR
jgi:hypothetical protein